jgi:Glycosyl hydrolase family 65 central catalytic domain/Glycosyl hydrolase family 65, N-terminal domain/Glycosyl hydrolase family 65, C-terminal domain
MRRLCIAAAARVLGYLFLALAAAGAQGETDGSFLLRAGLEDLPAYFPAYLGNGYFSTLSTPRGTEAMRSYVVALMDYATGDISRPAAIPGWTAMDFNPGAAGADQTWLNRAPLDARHFRDYRQTLNLREGTLITTYQYLDHGRETAIEVTTLISEASPHLAATRLRITPEYDGVVQLSFPLTLWAPHLPRFPLGEMTGSEMEEAVAASDLSLEPRNPATSDREAIWYPGYTEVRAGEGDGASMSLWLDGQAQQGLGVAMAAAVGLPEGTSPQTVTLHRTRYRLALDVSLKVQRGRSYDFTKFVAVSRAGWGGSSGDDLVLAREARQRGFERLAAEHRAAWDSLWQSDIVIEGDPKAQQVVHSELYYLLASATAGTAWSLGPCGLTLCYDAHVFWDADTWMFPALLLLHPERARPMVDFRERTLEPARQRARQRGFAGAMYPWESDPENGSEQTPHFASVLGDTEIHVNADVALAQWQYYLVTLDRDWLRSHGWPVIREVARFWSSRASYDPRTRRYSILHVNSVAESNSDIANDTFTNLVAAAALNAATAAARVGGERPDPLWERVARGLYIPLAPGGQHHLAFDPGVAPRGNDFGGGPISLLFLPALDVAMSPELRRGDYDYAIRPDSIARVGAGSMSIAPRTAAAAAIGNAADAAGWFASNFTGGTLKGPFNVRTETAGNNVGYFLTGSGGYLQSLLYGFTGLRIREAGLVEAYPPVLPPGWNSLTLRNLTFRGQRLDIRVARDTGGVARLTRASR